MQLPLRDEIKHWAMVKLTGIGLRLVTWLNGKSEIPTTITSSV